jgi:threonine/homoserine/homoserine lactone efflux protein
VIRSLALLVGGTVALWALVTYPARLLWPEPPGASFLFSTTAAVLCLVPTTLTLAWSRRAYKGQPEQQLAAVLGGTAVRMIFVMAVGLVLFYSIEAYQYQRFWLFVIFYYLVTLALEVVILVRSTPEQAQQKN